MNVIFHNENEEMKKLEKKLNERGFLYASELVSGLPWSSEGILDLDWEYEPKEILDDGTVILDWNPVSDNMMKLLTLESRLERKFMNLEERIENYWV